MTVQRAAFCFGLVFVVVAIAGFVAGGLSMDADPRSAPRVFAAFPVNALHNAVHLAFGAAGLVAAKSWVGARAYCRVAGVVYLALAAIGVTTPDLFGIMPIGGPVIGLHLALGAGLAWFGFAGRDARRPLPGGVVPSAE